MAELLADKGVGQIAVRTDAVPVAFVAVESGGDQFRIAFAKQNGPIRIALYGDPPEFHHIGVTEHFAPDFEDQGRFVERGTLFCQRQGEAIAAQLQNIHFRMIFLVWVYAGKAGAVSVRRFFVRSCIRSKDIHSFFDSENNRRAASVNFWQSADKPFPASDIFRTFGSDKPILLWR